MSLRGYLFVTLLAVGLTSAQSFGTESTDIGSNSSGLIAPRLARLQEGSSPVWASSDVAQSADDSNNLSDVKDGMLVFIYNVAHRFAKLSMLPNGKCDFESGDVAARQLWKLEEDPMRKGSFFLVNWSASQGTTTYRYAFNPNGYPSSSGCVSGIPKYDDQLWKFNKQSNGYWKIYNQGWYQGQCRIAVPSDTHGGAYCGPDYYDQYFRLQSAFDHSALWTIAESFDNASDAPVEITLKYSEGITDTITNTIAKSSSVEMSLSIGMEASLYGVGLSMEETLTVQQSFSESYSRALQKTWSVEKSVDITVPPHTRICIMQLKVNNVDNTNGIEFLFSSSLYRVAQGDDCN